jgi:hypothetical protein
VLVPTFAGPFVLFSGPTAQDLGVWVMIGMLYLLVLGELYHRRRERRHASAIIFALLGCVLNVVVAAAGLMILLSGMRMGI